MNSAIGPSCRQLASLAVERAAGRLLNRRRRIGVVRLERRACRRAARRSRRRRSARRRARRRRPRRSTGGPCSELSARPCRCGRGERSAQPAWRAAMRAERLIPRFRFAISRSTRSQFSDSSAISIEPVGARETDRRHPPGRAARRAPRRQVAFGAGRARCRRPAASSARRPA